MSSDKLNELAKQIEDLRSLLHFLSKNKELIDPELLAVSQMLDVVLNEYNRILKSKS